FKTLPLEKFGVEFIYPTIAAAHPFDDGTAAALYHSIEETAKGLGEDNSSYLKLMQPLVKDWSLINGEVLAPLHYPKHVVAMARFGIKALTSSTWLAKRFHTKEARGLLAGMAAHSIQPLTNVTTSAVALVLMITAHTKGWPIAKGGSASIAN